LEVKRWMAIEGGTAGRVGPYDLLDRIAIGGMAEVFLACERTGAGTLGRLVVIKRILPHLAENESFVDMFLQEAEIARRIQHDNVVRIYDTGDSGGFPWIAMEYVPGSTIREIIKTATDRGEHVPLGVALYLSLQLLAGAHAAHELRNSRGEAIEIVHRDLSPHNLVVTMEGRLKVLDFGIAKATEGMDTTRTGVLKGKLSYLSPEQCRQSKLDRRSDLFTIGIVIWEMIAGRKLFAAETELATMTQIVTGEVDNLAFARSDAPPELVEAVHRSLALEREDRYPTAEAFADALRRAAERANLEIDGEAAADWLDGMMGDRQRLTEEAIEEAFERTQTTMHPDFDEPKRPRSVVAVAAIGAAAAVAVFPLLVGVAWLIAPTPTVGAVDHTDPMIADVVYPGEPVRLVLAPTIDPLVLMDELAPIQRYLATSLERNIELKVADSYADAAEQLVAGTADLASLPPWIYVQTHRAHPAVELLAIKVYDGSSFSQGVLLVPEGSAAASTEDLVGKRICYSDPDSTTGYALPRAFLRRSGIDPDADFSEVVLSGNHLQVLRDLSMGVCDVGCTYTGAWRSDAGARTRILLPTGRSPHDAIVAAPGADAEVVDAVRTALLAFDPERDAGGRVVGEIEKISGFTRGVDADYDELRDALVVQEGEQ
jgi:serine/threonine-protein kinase